MTPKYNPFHLAFAKEVAAIKDVLKDNYFFNDCTWFLAFQKNDIEHIIFNVAVPIKDHIAIIRDLEVKIPSITFISFKKSTGLNSYTSITEVLNFFNNTKPNDLLSFYSRNNQEFNFHVITKTYEIEVIDHANTTFEAINIKSQNSLDESWKEKMLNVRPFESDLTYDQERFCILGLQNKINLKKEIFVRIWYPIEKDYEEDAHFVSAYEYGLLNAPESQSLIHEMEINDVSTLFGKLKGNLVNIIGDIKCFKTSLSDYHFPHFIPLDL